MKMDPYLVGSSGEDLAQDKGPTARFLQHFELCPSRPPTVGHSHFLTVNGMTANRRDDFPTGFGKFPAAQCQVEFLNLSTGKLIAQTQMCNVVFGNYQTTAGLFVESMHDPRSQLATVAAVFPYVALIRQMDVETVLAQALADRGIEVEYGTELLSAVDTPGAARAVLRASGRRCEADFAFIAGCDGPASTVRTLAGMGWPGAAYPVEILLADVELGGDRTDDRTHVVAGRKGIAFAFRLGEQATWRLHRRVWWPQAPLAQCGTRSHAPGGCRGTRPRRARA